MKCGFNSPGWPTGSLAKCFVSFPVEKKSQQDQRSNSEAHDEQATPPVEHVKPFSKLLPVAVKNANCCGS